MSNESNVSPKTVEEFLHALRGDERAQLRTLVRSLAIQLRMMTIIIPSEYKVLKEATQELADVALDFLKEDEL